MQEEGKYVGVDACRKGWVVVSLYEETAYVHIDIVETLNAAKNHFRKAKIVFIDIPIALPDTHTERECDKIARKILKKRASSIFRVPHINVSIARNYEEACIINENATGKRINKQAWNIFGRVIETRKFLKNNPEVALRFFESNPELCFYHLNDMVNLIYSKHISEGIEERRGILEKYIGRRELERLFSILRDFPRNLLSVDDVLDSLSMATVAKFFKGSYRYIPEHPNCDKEGFTLQMVF